MLGLAGKFSSALGNVGKAPFVQQRLSGGGKELLGHAATGGLFTGLATTLYTGNPLAGLAVGAADTLLSAGIAKQVGKISPKLAGKYYDVRPQGSKKFTQEYRPSMDQNIAMVGTSIATPILLEPLFAAQQVSNLSPEQLQALSSQPIEMDQTATSEQQLIQRQLLNQQLAQSLSPGTMFQMQGLESTLMRPSPGLDPYGLSKG